MSGLPADNGFAQRLAVLEERMNTRQAGYESALDRLRADMAAQREEMAKRETEAARRETRLLLSVAGIVLPGG